jgi:thiamine-monophosphate kinase
VTAGGLGEFGRIARYFAPLAGPGGLGLKDDAALVECPPGSRLVATVDQAVEGVHFLPDDPPDLVAKKLLRRNLSDLAAMGAVPRHYLVTSALPKSCGDEWVGGFAAGLRDDQRRYGIDLLGGDSTATVGPIVLTLTAIGEVAAGQEIRRAGAQPGDEVWVSGTIGDAFLGLKVRRGDIDVERLEPAHAAAVVERYRLPEPRTELGPRLAGIAHAMIDVSDGLVSDLNHICETSGVGATIALNAIPRSDAAKAIWRWVSPARLATGGDDYELLFAAPPDAAGAIAALSAELSLAITRIGEVAAGSGVRLLTPKGREVAIERTGYRHF